MRVAAVLGTRPEIIRLSRVIEGLDRHCELVLVHTGQNFDPALSDVFFDELGVRAPDRYLGITGEGFAHRVGGILAAAGPLFAELEPDKLLVLGDTDSALSAYVAKRMGIPVFHMEAGNRCFDDRVPEEVNRRVIDHSSDVLMPYTEPQPRQPAPRGHPPQPDHRDRQPDQGGDGPPRRSDRLPLRRSGNLGLEDGGYLLITVHRQETVDVEDRLRSLLRGAAAGAEDARAALDLQRPPAHARRDSSSSGSASRTSTCARTSHSGSSTSSRWRATRAAFSPTAGPCRRSAASWGSRR